MEPLFIKGTNKTPEIDFKPDGVLWLRGVSRLEDAYQFFREPVKWVSEYVLEPAEKTEMNIDLEFFNTSSQVNIFEMLIYLSELKKSGYDVQFNWYYDDEDLKDLGEDMSGILGVSFNFIKKKSSK